MGNIVKSAHIATISIAIGILLGYQYAINQELAHNKCGSYTTKYSDWVGWLTVKDGVYRCFYLESTYPWRVRQGVIDVK